MNTYNRCLHFSISTTLPSLLRHPQVNLSPHFCSHLLKYSGIPSTSSQAIVHKKDGSKLEQIASAVVWRNSANTVWLPNNASIFRAKLCAISLAIEVIRHSREKDFIIFSDSVSSLDAQSRCQLEKDLWQ